MKKHTIQLHPELVGRILYDPTEPATEEEWPSSCRCGHDSIAVTDLTDILPSREIEQEVLNILDAAKKDA